MKRGSYAPCPREQVRDEPSYLWPVSVAALYLEQLECLSLCAQQIQSLSRCLPDQIRWLQFPSDGTPSWGGKARKRKGNLRFLLRLPENDFRPRNFVFALRNFVADLRFLVWGFAFRALWPRVRFRRSGLGIKIFQKCLKTLLDGYIRSGLINRPI